MTSIKVKASKSDLKQEIDHPTVLTNTAQAVPKKNILQWVFAETENTTHNYLPQTHATVRHMHVIKYSPPFKHSAHRPPKCMGLVPA